MYNLTSVTNFNVFIWVWTVIATIYGQRLPITQWSFHYLVNERMPMAPFKGCESVYGATCLLICGMTTFLRYFRCWPRTRCFVLCWGGDVLASFMFHLFHISLHSCILFSQCIHLFNTPLLELCKLLLHL